MYDYPNEKVRIVTKLKVIRCKGGHNALPTGRHGAPPEHDTTGAHERISNSDMDILMGRPLAWEISIHLTQAVVNHQ